MSASNPLIEIKGLRDGLLATLGDASWEELRAALMEQIDSRGSFFRGARLALDVGGQVFHVNELSELRDTLSERGVNLWAVVSESPTTEKTSQLLGLATRISKPRPQEMARPLAEETGEGAAMWIGRTLRSGTRVEFAGSVVVIGDVNPGAEAVAEGSILVWGRVRGLVHAGSGGDESAFVCGLDLSAAQIRIGGAANVPPKKRSGEVRPEKFYLEDGVLKSEIWQSNQT